MSEYRIGEKVVVYKVAEVVGMERDIWGNMVLKLKYPGLAQDGIGGTAYVMETMVEKAEVIQ